MLSQKYPVKHSICYCVDILSSVEKGPEDLVNQVKNSIDEYSIAVDVSNLYVLCLVKVVHHNDKKIYKVPVRARAFSITPRNRNNKRFGKTRSTITKEVGDRICYYYKFVIYLFLVFIQTAMW